MFTFSFGHTETHKVLFFSYKQVSGRNGDHEWLIMTNAFILCDLVWNVQKCHTANRIGRFNATVLGFLCTGWTGCYTDNPGIFSW